MLFIQVTLVGTESVSDNYYLCLEVIQADYFKNINIIKSHPFPTFKPVSKIPFYETRIALTPKLYMINNYSQISLMKIDAKILNKLLVNIIQ